MTEPTRESGLRPPPARPSRRHPITWLCLGLIALCLAPRPASAQDGSRDRLTFRGDARARWLQVDVDGQPPAGLFGEALAQQTTFLQRLILELEGQITDRISAGGLLRISNEPDDVLRLGPDYFAEPTGSAFVAFDLPHLRARAGYYRTHFSPLTLMRWDERDIALGGSQRGCGACGATTAGVLVASLEDIQADLLFEGARASGELGSAVDWTALYARPATANVDLVPELDILDHETFQYHRDLYAGRLDISRLHRPTFTFQRLGLMVMHYADDPLNPSCPAETTNETCFATQQTAVGFDYRYALGRRLVFEGEWVRSAYHTDHRHPDPLATWATGYRLTAELTLIPRQLRWEAAFIWLDPYFASPYSAITYQNNRRGHRHRLVVSHRPVELDLFLRWMVPVEKEWLNGPQQAALAAHRLTSAQLTLALPANWQARLGVQHEQEILDLVTGADAKFREPQRDITGLALSYDLDGVEISFDQQWIWEKKALRASGSGSATIASISATAHF